MRQAAADSPLEPLDELGALRADGRVARRLVQAQGLEHAGVLLAAVGVRDGAGERAEGHLVGGEQQRQAAFVGGAAHLVADRRRVHAVADRDAAQAGCRQALDERPLLGGVGRDPQSGRHEQVAGREPLGRVGHLADMGP